MKPILVTNCPEVLHRLVLEGLGIGRFCECNVSDDLHGGRPVHLLPDWKVTDIPVLAVYPDNRQIAAKVRTFVDFLARRLAPTLSLKAPIPARGSTTTPDGPSAA